MLGISLFHFDEDEEVPEYVEHHIDTVVQHIDTATEHISHEDYGNAMNQDNLWAAEASVNNLTFRETSLGDYINVRDKLYVTGLPASKLQLEVDGLVIAEKFQTDTTIPVGED